MRRLPRRGLLVLATAGLLALGSAAPAVTTHVWLRDVADVRLKGAGNVASAGDVNGDGFGDVVVTRGDLVQEPSEGITYVVFGGPGLEDRELDSLTPEQGFAIFGATHDDRARYSVGAGDVNGDGLDDVAVGAPNADNNGDFSTGTTYIVFGKADGDDVFLQDFDDNTQGLAGYRIDGRGFLVLAGRAVAGAGDVNDDGLADVLVGAPFAGATYVVFGKTTPSPVDLGLFDEGLQGDAGYRIATPSPENDLQYSVAGAGDVNGDGTPDAVIGVIRRLASPGSAYVVFGKADAAPVRVSQPGEWGFRIRGVERGDFTGFAVAGPGDVNGDSFDDVIVGAPDAYRGDYIGNAYVVFGRPGSKTVDLDQLKGQGFKIKGEGDLEQRWKAG